MTEETAARPTRAARAKSPGASTVARPRAATKRAVAVPIVAEAGLPAAVPAADGSAPERVDRLAINQGGLGALKATDVAVSQGGVGAVRADRLSVELGGVGAAMADQIEVRQGLVGGVLAREARFEQAGVRTLIANHVHFGPNSGAGVVLAARVDGDVQTLLDWRGALVFGAAAGLVITILRGRRH
jgi:hypothetical protein